MTTQSPVFKSAHGQAQFLAAYDAAMALWGVPFERRDVRTRFGSTHVIASGAESAPPLVLLHCALMTSAIWSPVIGDLSAHFRTYAVDVIGDVGRTIPSNPPRTYEDFGRWLDETLDALGVTKASVLGWSFGGFAAANFAIHAPVRVARLVLLAPFATFVRPGLGFLAGFLPMMLPTRRVSRWFERRLCYAGTFGPAEHSELLYRRFRYGRVAFKIAPRTFSDDELARLTMPTLLLVGEQEFLYDGHAAVQRARRSLPNCRAHLIPQCNHAVVSDQTAILRAHLLDFLKPGTKEA
jgi:pimeloyl-ACP methyl ester carboxylesterase